MLCDGMPSIPRKQPLAEFLARRGFWVIYPRYRGAWESSGEFLAKSPHEDILDILDELPRELEEIAFARRFRLLPDQVFVIGGSFGGAAAILLSLDPRVKRAVANCPVVDWGILDKAVKAETSNENYAQYIREAFGNAYRISDANWSKLRNGTFYNPWQHRSEIRGSKLMIFHAKDDPNVPYERTREFAELTGATLKSNKRGGHISTDDVVRKYWTQIERFSIRLDGLFEDCHRIRTLLNVSKLLLSHAEIVSQFMDESLANLMTNFCLARTDRFDILLIKHDVGRTTERSKTLFFVAAVENA